MLILPACILWACLITSCTQNRQDGVASQAPRIVSIKASESIFFTGHPVVFSVQVEDPTAVAVLWDINGQQYMDGTTFDFTPLLGGRNTLKVVVTNDLGQDSSSLTFDVLRTRGAQSSQWISRVFDYTPAPGQFINTSSGNEQAVQGIIGKRGMVSLGGYGGSIVFGFDHSVVDGQGTDFVIHGNAFKGSSEPGAVAVAFDANGNGLPDDEFYELRGSGYDGSAKKLGIKYLKPSQTDSAESVEWVTTSLERGQIEKVVFHGQCYYPLFMGAQAGESTAASIVPNHGTGTAARPAATTLTKSTIPAELNFTGNLVVNPSAPGPDGIWINPSLEWGYADNYTPDYDQPLGDDPLTARSNKFDIHNAVDSAAEPVNLSGIDFIKVYTCVNEQSGPLGEISCDVCGAISLTPIR